MRPLLDTDAPSYCHFLPHSVLCAAESEKKRKYLRACLDRQAGFTPLCVFIDGMLDAETGFFLKHLGNYFTVS